MSGNAFSATLFSSDPVMPTTQETHPTAELVWGQPSKRLAQEIAGFWVLNDAVVHPVEIKRRLAEVLVVLRDADHTIIGITTTYPYPMPSPGRYIGLRTFIAPTARRLSTLMLMSDAVIGALDGWAKEPTGLVFCADNRKFMGDGNRRWFKRRGWARISADDAEKDEFLLMVGPQSS